MNLSLREQVEPKLFCCKVMFSLVWESKLGFSIRQFTNNHMWFFTCTHTQSFNQVNQRAIIWVLSGLLIIWMYLERFDSHSSLVLLFNHFNQFGHNLVCNIVGVSATLKHKNTVLKGPPSDRLGRMGKKSIDPFPLCCYGCICAVDSARAAP